VVGLGLVRSLKFKTTFYYYSTLESTSRGLVRPFDLREALLPDDGHDQFSVVFSPISSTTVLSTVSGVTFMKGR
jgi:hypothetical protein